MALPIDLSGKRALVTGVTSGIGAGIAATLATAGCDVVGCGRREPTSEGAVSFVQSVERAGTKACYVPSDLSDPRAPASLVAAAAETLGGLDLIVSNAGRNMFFGAAECTDAQWQACMDLDLTAHWRIARAAKPYFDRSPAQAVAIFIGSNHAWSTIPGCFPYNVAKAGLLALVQSLAIEWGPHVRAVGIAPGFIETPANDAWFGSFPDPEAELARTQKSHPAGKLGSPVEIGACCAFLASEHAAFVTGTTILVDGGRSALMQDR